MTLGLVCDRGALVVQATMLLQELRYTRAGCFISCAPKEGDDPELYSVVFNICGGYSVVGVL